MPTDNESAGREIYGQLTSNLNHDRKQRIKNQDLVVSLALEPRLSGASASTNF
jgi:hypothetical protein